MLIYDSMAAGIIGSYVGRRAVNEIRGRLMDLPDWTRPTATMWHLSRPSMNGPGERHRCSMRTCSMRAPIARASSAMNEALGVATVLLPAQPGLAAVSSTVLRGLSI
jgi:hypothetical protein